MKTLEIVSEFSFDNRSYVVKKELHPKYGEEYNVYADEVCVQPGHDAEGIIRYLSSLLQHADFLRGRK